MQRLNTRRNVKESRRENKSRPTKSERANSLVLAHRATAMRIAQSMMKRWGLYVDRDELQSIVDLVLCETSHRYKPSKGASFVTFIFLALKGKLLREFIIKRKFYPLEVSLEAAQEGDLNWDKEIERSAVSDHSECPHYRTYLGELRAICNEAISHLNNLEKEVVMETVVFESKVASYARKIGYSRGHMSSLRSAALRKIKHKLNSLEEQNLTQAAA